MKIAFLGSGAFGIPSLEALARSGHEMVGVITQPDRPAGRGKEMTATPVGAWAGSRGLEVVKTENANSAEVLAKLKAWGAGGAECLVVIAFGQKLSAELLATAPRGGINLHSSLLPKFRGAAPINWAVIKGERETGVSVIEVTQRMDAGGILAQARTEIGRAETAGELHDRLAELGAPLLPLVLDEMAAGAVRRVAQEEALATRAPKLSREMAWVDFSRPAGEVSARIRGMSPWPGVQVELVDSGGKVRVVATVVKCQVADGARVHGADEWGKVLADRRVACGVGSVEFLVVQPVGKKGMDVKAFANGYGFGLGARVKSVVKQGEK